MRFKNMTPHPIDIYRVDRDSVLATIEPTGNVVRLEERPGELGGQLWIPHGHGVEIKDWEETENYALSVACVTRQWSAGAALEEALPEEEGTIYIVAMPVLAALAEPRQDVCCPDFGDGAVRGSRGSVIGTRRLVFRSLDGCVSGAMSPWRWVGDLEQLLEGLATSPTG